MVRRDETAMGGPDGQLHTTHWTVIFEARSTDEERRREALRDLFNRYWKPVYCYLRRKGRDNETAKDTTQAFLQDIFLGRDLVGKADPKRGKFRTFLLTALDHYLVSLHRHDSARKRSPETGLLSLDALESSHDVEEPDPEMTPDQAFHRAWAVSLLDEVLEAVEDRCRRTAREVHWHVFRSRVVQPILENVEPPPLKELCRRYGVADEVQASNMIVTVKRWFRETLTRRVAESVPSGDEVEQEIRDLMEILSKT
ncbi:MAG TPA: hypothetical protein VMX57_07320 [Planctomycetota bacterium]|nr:hypothetical protein [Planctomycetota bacterium]